MKPKLAPPAPRPHAPLRLWALTLSAALVSVISGCDTSGAAPAGAAAPPAVSVAAAVARVVQQTDEFSGRLEASEQVDLRPRVGGYIARVHFRAGQEVNKGQLLFSIDADTYRAEVARARAQLAGARASAALARTELTRAETLLAQNGVSRAEFDQAAAAALTQAAAAQAAEAALEMALLNLGYTDIRAPIAGRISRSLLTEGNLVKAGESVLASITSLDRIYAYFDASESTYLRYLRQNGGPLAAGRKVPVPIQMGLMDETGYPHPGQLDAFDNRIDAQTGAIRTRAVFDNKARQLSSGLYARLRLVSGEPVSAVLVPERSLGTDQGHRFVVVVGNDGKAQFREVKLGARLEGLRVISSGLQAGEQVVVEGLQRVRPGSTVTAQRVQLDANGQLLAGGPASTGAPR